MKIAKAEVVNCPIANTRYGKKRVLNCKLLPSKEKVACWSNDLNNPIYLSKKPGDIVELIKDDKGKYSVLDREETVSMNRPSSNGSEGSYYTYSPERSERFNGNNPSAPSSVEDRRGDDLEELDLPQPLSDADKVRLSKLIRERAKLLTHTIEVMRDELNDKGLEFHEGSIRSLSVSLFIHISRHLD